MLLGTTLTYFRFIAVLVSLGFLKDDERDYLKSPIPWKQATKQILGASSDSEQDLSWAISSKASFKDNETKEQLMAGLKWIGLFSDEQITPRGNPLDVLCSTLEKKMQFEAGERDLVFLQHKFEIEHKSGEKETRTSTMVEYGDVSKEGGYSAMAKTVGIPCGVAVLQVLNGTISEKGVLAPMSSKINDPLMKELKEKYNIECIEKTL